jgi:hypothetical protein
VNGKRRTLTRKSKRGIKIHTAEVHFGAQGKIQAGSITDARVDMADPVGGTVGKVECRTRQKQEHQTRPIGGPATKRIESGEIEEGITAQRLETKTRHR